MGTNPGAWLSGLGPAGAALILAGCVLGILGARLILAAAHKYKLGSGEVRISWKEISVRWSQEAPQEESEALKAPEDTPAVEKPQAAAGEDVTPDGGDAVA